MIDEQRGWNPFGATRSLLQAPADSGAEFSGMQVSDAKRLQQLEDDFTRECIPIEVDTSIPSGPNAGWKRTSTVRRVRE